MSQPTTYDRQFSFTNYTASFPTTPLPGTSVDLELNTIKTTLDEVLANLAILQRDDTALANLSVGFDQLSAEVTAAGFARPTVWVTATAYALSDAVFHGSGFYRCLIAHTSGVFATDLTAVKWELIIDMAALTIVAASQIANTPAGTIAATTVQAAIDELASEKTAADISDSTAAGRALITAANVAAQLTALGLAALGTSGATIPLLSTANTWTLAQTFTAAPVFSTAVSFPLGATSPSPTAGIGYSTGAGGAVTQITSKATGVTLNTITGAITTNNAALAATTTVGFTLTNSAIAATDAIIVNIVSGATTNSYGVRVTAISAGSCRIELRNETAGGLSEALVLRFLVLKGVSA